MSQKTNTAHTGREIIKKIVFLFGGGKRQEGKGKSVISTGSLGRLFSDIVPEVLFKKKKKIKQNQKNPNPKPEEGLEITVTVFIVSFGFHRCTFVLTSPR